MSMEICKLCNQDSTPWFYINGHICEDCYHNCRRIFKLETRWISFKDNQPYAGQEILFCYMGEILLPVTFGIYLGDKFKEFRFYSHDGKSYNATHWMPLPELPK